MTTKSALKNAKDKKHVNMNAPISVINARRAVKIA
jgi:hypothetical protein